MAQEAAIAQLPLRRRICSECENSAIGPYGVHCLLFNEDIHNERVAEECEAWEPLPQPTVRASRK